MSCRCLPVLVVLLASRLGAAGKPADAFETANCWFAPPPGVSVRCGIVTVPESRNRAAAAPGTVRIAVAVFSKAAGPARGALFFLSGGPGDAAIDLTVRLLPSVFSAFLDQRDLVAIDQRGTGHSEPSLNCPMPDRAACRAQLVRQGIDLGSYTTLENAADINAVRQALGYRRIDLLGGSYGTILAQAVMRDYPETVRTAVLDSPAPLQELVHLELTRHFEPALQVLFDACRADRSCNENYPNLRDTFYGLIERLNARPLHIQAPGGAAGRAAGITLTGGQFGFLIWQSLYYSEAIPHLPRIICDTAAGDYQRLIRLIEKQQVPDERSEGFQQSVECAEMAPFIKQEQLTEAAQRIPPALRQTALRQFGDVFERCSVWKVPAASPRVKEPLRSSIPVLLMVGAFDPATPPRSARRTAETLTRHYLFVFPDSGHGVFRTNACARALIGAFLADPGRSPRGACMERLTSPVFVSRAEAH